MPYTRLIMFKKAVLHLQAFARSIELQLEHVLYELCFEFLEDLLFTLLCSISKHRESSSDDGSIASGARSATSKKTLLPACFFLVTDQQPNVKAGEFGKLFFSPDVAAITAEFSRIADRAVEIVSTVERLSIQEELVSFLTVPNCLPVMKEHHDLPAELLPRNHLMSDDSLGLLVTLIDQAVCYGMKLAATGLCVSKLCRPFWASFQIRLQVV